MRRTGGTFTAMLVAGALVLTACGSSNNDKSSTTKAPDTTAASSDTTAATATGAKFMTPEQVKESWKTYTTTDPGVPLPQVIPTDTSGSVEGKTITDPDVNGDGKVVIGIATVGDSKDQGFYQSFIDKAQAFVDRYKDDGWSLIVVDRVNPADAAQQIKNLCQQGADLVAMGDSQLADGIPAYQSPECAKTAAYVNGGAGIEQKDFFAQAQDRVDPLLYVAGVAAGLVLKENGGKKAGFVTGPELDFSKAAAHAWEVGVKSEVPDAEVVNTFTGDFDDSAKGQEAAKAQISQGVKIIYPYLGGATNAVVKEANAADVPALTPGNFRCDDKDYNFAMSVIFDPGYMMLPFLQKFHDGKYKLGELDVYYPGRQPEDSVVICKPTPAQEDTLAQLISDIGADKVDVAKLVGG